MQAVKVPVTAPVCVQCEFWREDDGLWIGRCPELSIWVEGSSFVDAKAKMEEALRDHLLAMLHSATQNAAAA